jgi:hypothetical protein
MKVDREKFIEAMNYLREINTHRLEDLDLSDFTDRDLSKEIKEWKFTGLINRDFIQMVLINGDEFIMPDLKQGESYGS